MAVQLQTLHQQDEPPIVFVSYAHEDEEWKDKLLPHLSQLGGLGILQVWDDRQIKAGVDWYARIKEILSKTRCAVCLITANFLNSSFCMDEEIPYLLQQRHKGNLEIFPVLLEDCVWEEHPWLKRWQILPRDAKPVLTHFADNPAQVFAEVARQVRDYLNTGKGHERPEPVGPAPNVDIGRLPETGELLFGRRAELRFLTRAWDEADLNVVALVASGGVGKSTLVRCWVESIAEDNYRGAERIFAWSFYSQGTKERVTSADEFIAEALRWFGDETEGQGLSPWDRGHRLAELIRQRRTLLLLDGLEPLQSGYAFDRGKLKDPGLEVLLFELAERNPGLCVITTREPVADLADDEIKAAARQIDLNQISTVAGRALLRVSGIEGEDQELEAAVKTFGKHAYAIKLLGAWINQWHDRNIKQAEAIPNLDIPIEEGRHPRRVMQAFAERFGAGPKANLLALLGLFDRPADAATLAALRAPPAILGLTEHVVDLSPTAWEKEIADLRHLGLLAPPSHHAPDDLDAHPLVREHFGGGLKAEHPDAWRAGHGRLYEHLRDSAEPLPDTLAGMAPLFQAMHHGCQAGQHGQALMEVYLPRIQRHSQFFSTEKLGAWGADLVALAGLFVRPWESLIPTVPPLEEVDFLQIVGYRLFALGRLSEAVTLTKAAIDRAFAEGKSEIAGRVATILAELEVTRGHIKAALEAAEAGVALDRRRKAFSSIFGRATLAHVLHQLGDLERAEALFKKAEAIQAGWQPHYPRLYSLQGYWYCDLLLTQDRPTQVRERAHQWLQWANTEPAVSLRDVPLMHLALGRAELALEKRGDAKTQLDTAIRGLRRAGQISRVPFGLLARAAVFRETGDFSAARRDLDEAMRIAKRSKMRLHQCDARLEYARLALAQGDNEKVRDHIAAARRLVDETGYGRRRPEVEELEAQLR